MDLMLFPDEALAILRTAVYRPDAERVYEVMSGGFSWSDELLWESYPACRRHGSWAFRCLMSYRATVISGAPQLDLRPVWDQVTREGPNWPGLRLERSSTTLATELRWASLRQCVELRRLERKLETRSPGDGPDPPEPE
jgi:hypothetical protein